MKQVNSDPADAVTRCPRCGCAWGSEEIERDTCFACGWDNSDEYWIEWLKKHGWYMYGGE